MVLDVERFRGEHYAGAYWLAEQVRDGRMAFSRAASLAQMPVGVFLRSLGRLRIPVLDLDEDELERQLRDAREAG